MEVEDGVSFDRQISEGHYDPSTAPTSMSTEDSMKLDRKEKIKIWLCLLDPVLLNIERSYNQDTMG
jgi:hypothetical protein